MHGSSVHRISSLGSESRVRSGSSSQECAAHRKPNSAAACRPQCSHGISQKCTEAALITFARCRPALRMVLSAYRLPATTQCCCIGVTPERSSSMVTSGPNSTAKPQPLPLSRGLARATSHGIPSWRINTGRSLSLLPREMSRKRLRQVRRPHSPRHGHSPNSPSRTQPPRHRSSHRSSDFLRN